jgi:predicted 2-oxoglutarate/Fe(II)-dependent dioxygenase YbiX
MSGHNPLEDIRFYDSVFTEDDAAAYRSLVGRNSIYHDTAKTQSGEEHDVGRPGRSANATFVWSDLVRKVNEVTQRYNDEVLKLGPIRLNTRSYVYEMVQRQGGVVEHADDTRDSERLITTVAFIYPEREWSDGDLTFVHGNYKMTHNYRLGTVACFPSHVRHYVTPVKGGRRLTFVTWAGK